MPISASSIEHSSEAIVKGTINFLNTAEKQALKLGFKAVLEMARHPKTTFLTSASAGIIIGIHAFINSPTGRELSQFASDSNSFGLVQALEKSSQRRVAFYQQKCYEGEGNLSTIVDTSETQATGGGTVRQRPIGSSPAIGSFGINQEVVVVGGDDVFSTICMPDGKIGHIATRLIK